MIDENARDRPRRHAEPDPTRLRAIPYPFSRRMADRWHGWRDGRKGIPAMLDHELAADAQIVDETGEAPAGPGARAISQMHYMLICEALEQVAFERRRCVLEILEPHKRLVEERMRFRGLREGAEASKSELEEFRKPDFNDPGLRRSVERDAEHVTDDLARRRRMGEYRAQLDRLHRAYLNQRGRYETARSNALAHRLDILTRCELAAFSARGIWHHYQRRRAVYNQQLMRSHRDGGHLARILEQAEPRLPDWVEEPHRLAADLSGLIGDPFDTDPMEP